MRNEVTWKEREGDWVFDSSPSEPMSMRVSEAEVPVELYDSSGSLISIRKKIGFGK